MADIGGLGLLATGFGLGLRHGVDWDHIAAIADITGAAPAGGDGAAAGAGGGTRPESWARFFLATLYAAGHAAVVVALGLLAIWTSSLLPAWVDPVMERVVGATLVLLGVWIFASLWRDGMGFRPRSRWMLVFGLAGQGWRRLRGRATGVSGHQHAEAGGTGAYGRRAAFAIGALHGIGAETGSQALLLAGAAGATTSASGSALLLAFTVGLVVSNSAIAALSAFGFVSAGARQRIYVGFGVVAGVFSLAVGWFLLTGTGDALPDLGALLERIG